MGKSRVEELPTLNRGKVIQATSEELDMHTELATVADLAAPIVEVAEPQRLATIEVPLGSIDPHAYIPIRERLEAKAMTQQQSIGLLRLTRGLQERGDTLRDGTPIKRGAQAVRWMLEQMANGSR